MSEFIINFLEHLSSQRASITHFIDYQLQRLCIRDAVSFVSSEEFQTHLLNSLEHKTAAALRHRRLNLDEGYVSLYVLTESANNLRYLFLRQTPIRNRNINLVY